MCDGAALRGEVFSAEACLQSETVARGVIAQGWDALPPDLAAACMKEGEMTGSYGVMMTCIINGPVAEFQPDPVAQ